MSEMKFRAWDKINQKMLYLQEEKAGCIPLFTDGNRYVSLEIVYFNQNGNSFEKLGDTGLKDKNNKKIYEGDIIKIPNHGFRVILSVPGGYAVESLDSDVGKYGQQFYTPIEGLSDEQNAGWIQQFEVVGNIYENPDLLVQLMDR